MPTRVATHSGQFHADDVTAWALVKTFYDPDATLVRTRDPARLAAADVVFDVGAVFDPATLRFDHHQASYEGPMSSAGMVLQWLRDAGHVPARVADVLRAEGVDYIDDVDNGRRAPDPAVPCVASMVDAYNQPAEEPDAQLAAFLDAGEAVAGWIRGVVARLDKIARAEAAVVAEMDRAAAQGDNVLRFDSYLAWKEPYFAHGGEAHPTEYVLFPGHDGTWRIVAIPPVLGDFGQKRPLPEAWAGLTDAALAQASGVHDAVFCHKNLFIAVFRSRDGALQALESTGRVRRG